MNRLFRLTGVSNREELYLPIQRSYSSELCEVQQGACSIARCLQGEREE